jgi:hypothetical protein
MATPPSFTTILTVSYENLFCIPSSERLWQPARRKARGLLSGSSTPGHQLRSTNLYMNGSLQWQAAGKPYTSYRIWPLPLLADEEGPPT